MANKNLQRKIRRKRRVSSNITGTSERPRLSVYRSNRFIYAQAIDDSNRKTLVSFGSNKMDGKKSKTEEAMEVGKKMAELLKKTKIDTVVYDRSSYAYKGRVKAIAEGLREGGIKV